MSVPDLIHRYNQIEQELPSLASANQVLDRCRRETGQAKSVVHHAQQVIDEKREEISYTKQRIHRNKNPTFCHYFVCNRAERVKRFEEENREREQIVMEQESKKSKANEVLGRCLKEQNNAQNLADRKAGLEGERNEIYQKVIQILPDSAEMSRLKGEVRQCEDERMCEPVVKHLENVCSTYLNKDSNLSITYKWEESKALLKNADDLNNQAWQIWKEELEYAQRQEAKVLLDKEKSEKVMTEKILNKDEAENKEKRERNDWIKEEKEKKSAKRIKDKKWYENNQVTDWNDEDQKWKYNQFLRDQENQANEDDKEIVKEGEKWENKEAKEARKFLGLKWENKEAKEARMQYNYAKADLDEKQQWVKMKRSETAEIEHRRNNLLKNRDDYMWKALKKYNEGTYNLTEVLKLSKMMNQDHNVNTVMLNRCPELAKYLSSNPGYKIENYQPLQSINNHKEKENEDVARHTINLALVAVEGSEKILYDAWVVKSYIAAKDQLPNSEFINRLVGKIQACHGAMDVEIRKMFDQARAAHTK